MIKAILFDMDGVLIDAKEWHFLALNQALSLFGMEISHYDHLVTYDGLPTKKKLEMLTIERSLPVRLHELINELKQEYTIQLAYKECKPIYSQQYMFRRLKNEGYRLASCSNSIRNTMDVFFDRANIKHFFEFYISNEDVSQPKPSPEMYIKAMKKMGLTPSQCLILEDNENGIKAAKDSSAHVMIINDISDVNYENIINVINNLKAEV